MKLSFLFMSDKHETGSEVEVNHVHRKPLLWFQGCHEWNGEWMFYAFVSHQNWKRFTARPGAEHSLCFTGGFLFYFIGDLIHASPQLDFESQYTFDAYLPRAVNLLNLLKTPLLFIKCEYISFLCYWSVWNELSMAYSCRKHKFVLACKLYK